MVWLDQNNNGVHDSLEEGIPNVLLELSPAGSGSPVASGAPVGNGAPVSNGASSLLDSPPLSSFSRFTYTDAEGYFLFENVPVGNYILIETDPEGVDSEIPNEVPVTVVADQVVEANIRDVPAQWGIFLPLILFQ